MKAGIPPRTYREIEKGNAAVELDVVKNVADVLEVTPAQLLAPLFLPTPERGDVDAAWARAVLRAVETEAKKYGALVHERGVSSAVVSLTVIAEQSPLEVPFWAEVLGSRASDLHLALADRIRRMQGEADLRAAELAQKTPTKTTRRKTPRGR